MEHRHMSNQFMIPRHYQHENNHPPLEQSYIPTWGVATENGNSVTPMDHTIRGGSHSNWDIGSRRNEYHSSNVSMQTQHLPPPFSRPPFDPYTHTSTNGNTSLTQIQSTHGISESGGPLKRKTPGVFEGSSSSFYDAGSSSSSHMQVQNPADRLPYRGSYLLSNGEDSIRNVRRRSEHEWEPYMTRAHVPNYASQYHQPTTTHPANYPVPIHTVNPSADVTGQEWNIVPYAASYNRRTSYTDINDPRRETSQFYGGWNSVDTDASHHNPYFRGNLASSQNPHVSHVHPTRVGHSYHHQRVTPFYRNGPNYCSYNNGASSSTNELHFSSENFSSRYSSYSTLGRGDGGYWGVRSNAAVERLQPLVDVMNSPNYGFEHETVTVEQSSFYGEAIDFPDQYQDMRLDIDDMNYEELLALEERIGYVSSGLSEDEMSKCLREKVYYSMEQNHDHCPICLEEYKNGEKIGRMKKCGHEYHVDCIKKWVVMKKVCPVCKSEC